MIKNQFGLRKYHFSHMSLKLIFDAINKTLDNDDCMVGIFLDFSKAFNTFNYKILLNKHYGIRGNALDCFRSYLLGRSQFATYNGEQK